MRPQYGSTRVVQPCFPRVSGDAPAADLRAEEQLLFSPRERGCAADGTDDAPRTVVFPA